MEEGDFVGIIGATGSGKSTLITHMNGLNKPTSGKIYIDGRDLWADPEKIRDFRFLTGLVFQYRSTSCSRRPVIKISRSAPRTWVWTKPRSTAACMKPPISWALTRPCWSAVPFELSGGQKRQVAVAGVMAMKPRILVLDEPAAGLDPEGRDDILSEVKEYHKKDRHHCAAGVPTAWENIAQYAKRSGG